MCYILLVQNQVVGNWEIIDRKENRSTWIIFEKIKKKSVYK